MQVWISRFYSAFFNCSVTLCFAFRISFQVFHPTDDGIHSAIRRTPVLIIIYPRILNTANSKIEWVAPAMWRIDSKAIQLPQSQFKSRSHHGSLTSFVWELTVCDYLRSDMDVQMMKSFISMRQMTNTKPKMRIRNLRMYTKHQKTTTIIIILCIFHLHNNHHFYNLEIYAILTAVRERETLWRWQT